MLRCNELSNIHIPSIQKCEVTQNLVLIKNLILCNVSTEISSTNIVTESDCEERMRTLKIGAQNVISRREKVLHLIIYPGKTSSCSSSVR